MNLLFVIPTMRMGGAEKSLCNLLSCLVEEKDYNISVLYFAREGELLTEVPKAVKQYALSPQERAMVLEWRYYHRDLIHPFNVHMLTRRVIVLFRDHLQRLLKAHLFDSWKFIKPVISYFPGNFDIAIGYLEGTADFYVLDKVSAKKKIGWIHTDISKNTKNIKIDCEYYKRFDRIATITDACELAFLNRIPELQGRVDVVPNISNVKKIRALSDKNVPFCKSNDRFVIVTIGRLEYEKGIDLAVKAAEELLKKGFEFEWHVYGEGSKQNQIVQLIDELGLNNRFVLEGVVQNPYPFMKCSDVIVQPSRFEGKSIVLDEAKILGKPIIVTNYPSVSDQIINEENGIICDYGADNIADAIIRVCTDKGLSKKISEGCLKESDRQELGYKAFKELLQRAVR